MRKAYAAVVLLALAGCGKSPPPSTAAVVEFSPKKLDERAGLHNLIRVNEWLYTGSEPEGDAGFQSLTTLGVRTVVTVDGARPDLTLADKHGLRYVHVPIGYNAIPKDRVLQIAKAFQTLPRPIYLHCHHGKHRGPAAAITAVRCLDGTCSAVQAVEYLKLAGTDPRYAELYASVETQKPLQPAELDLVPAEFKAAADVPDFTATMVKIDIVWAQLQKSKSVADAILLHEHYRELQRLPGKYPAGLMELLKQGEAEAKRIAEASDPAAKDMALSASGQLCSQCHKEYRDQSGGK